MPLPRLYSDLADLWPLVSPPDEYAYEATIWRDVLRDKLGPGRHQVLELGVGGGHNLHHLSSEFDAVAVDISSQMLANAIALNPRVEYVLGDMRSVRLNRRFKAVLIHDAASYLLDESELRQTFATAFAHLDKGGVLIAAPDYFRETFRDGTVEHDTHQHGALEIIRIEYQYDPDPGDTTMETEMFFIIRQGQSCRIELDHHTTGLFSLNRWLELIDKAGFNAEAVDYPVHTNATQAHLLVGVRR